MSPSHASYKDSDAASTTSTSTFASTITLLKEKAHISHKEHKPSNTKSEQSGKKVLLADVVTGAHKTRTLPLPPEEKRRVLREFVLMTK